MTSTCTSFTAKAAVLTGESADAGGRTAAAVSAAAAAQTIVDTIGRVSVIVTLSVV